MNDERTTFVALITINAKSGPTSIYGIHDAIKVIEQGALRLGYECKASYFSKPVKVETSECEIVVQLEPKVEE